MQAWRQVEQSGALESQANKVGLQRQILLRVNKGGTAEAQAFRPFRDARPVYFYLWTVWWEFFTGPSVRPPGPPVPPVRRPLHMYLALWR